MNQADQIAAYAELRFVVGFLGERGQHGWWDTSFLNDTGLKFLEINFPRSVMSAGCTSVTEAAKRIHDARIGKSGVFHLFRFPASIEQTVHEAVMQVDGDSMRAKIGSPEVAMATLAEMVDATVDAPEGPVQVGAETKILTASAVAEVAKHYLDAFSNDKTTVPYFVGS